MHDDEEFYSPSDAGSMSDWLYREWLHNAGQYARTRFLEHKEVHALEMDAIALYKWVDRYHAY